MNSHFAYDKIMQNDVKTRLLLLLSLFFCLFGCISYFMWDDFFISHAHLSLKPYALGFKCISFLASPPLHAIALALLLLASRFALIDTKKRFFFFELSCSQCLGVICAHMMKILIGRPRPHTALTHPQLGFQWGVYDHQFHSFPSGHTMFIFILAVSLSLYYPRFALYFLIGAFLIASSRFFLLKHYPSDVLITATLAIWIEQISHSMLKKVKIFRKNNVI